MASHVMTSRVMFLAHQALPLTQSLGSGAIDILTLLFNIVQIRGIFYVLRFEVR